MVKTLTMALHLMRKAVVDATVVNLSLKRILKNLRRLQNLPKQRLLRNRGAFFLYTAFVKSFCKQSVRIKLWWL